MAVVAVAAVVRVRGGRAYLPPAAVTSTATATTNATPLRLLRSCKPLRVRHMWCMMVWCHVVSVASSSIE